MRIPIKSIVVLSGLIVSLYSQENLQGFDVPTIPNPVIEEAAVPEAEPQAEKSVGIDTITVEDPQGNWLFKKIWWERAEERYGKIRELVSSIWESRTQFFVQRNQLDREVLDPFYISIGMNQGELNIILSELDDFFVQEREKDGDLNDQERTLYQALVEEQEAFQRLKVDASSIANLDHAIDDALSVLMDQINKARQLEKQAWENFREIAHVLNDIKARELYYLMDGAGRNIKNISIYLEKDFSNHFARLIVEAKKHVNRVMSQMQSLKEKGVDFKRQADRLAQQEEEQKNNMQQEAEAEELAKTKPKKEQGWMDWVLSIPSMIWDGIVSVVRIPYDLFFGK
jgi:hypothetical protein